MVVVGRECGTKPITACADLISESAYIMSLARKSRSLRIQWRLYPFVRTFAVKATPNMTEGERHIFNILNDKLDPGSLAVQDVSGAYDRRVMGNPLTNECH